MKPTVGRQSFTSFQVDTTVHSRRTGSFQARCTSSLLYHLYVPVLKSIAICCTKSPSSRSYLSLNLTYISVQDPSIPTSDTIQQLVERCINSLEPDLRAALLANVVLTGGGTLLSGMADRVFYEIQRLYPSVGIALGHLSFTSTNTNFADRGSCGGLA